MTQVALDVLPTSTVINCLRDCCHLKAVSSGWWTDENGNDIRYNPLRFSNKLLMIISEVIESMEGDRSDLMDDKLPHRPMREVELADALIRILDLAGAYDLDIGGAVEEKMAYNETREDHKPENRSKKGGKKY